MKKKRKGKEREGKKCEKEEKEEKKIKEEEAEPHYLELGLKKLHEKLA